MSKKEKEEYSNDDKDILDELDSLAEDMNNINKKVLSSIK